jgi:uncharacterized protein
VILRMGIVVGHGGALSLMALPFRFFAGGPIGSGRQWVSWIHVEDVANIARFILDHPSVQGPVNCCTPSAVTMRDWAAEIGLVLGRPSWLPVPSAVLRVLLGELSTMMLWGQKVIPARLQQAGYEFLHPRLHDALAASL